ncbi:Group-specific protein [Bacillus paramycoides]
MLKKFLANVLFMLVVTLLAVEYMPNKNPYIFVSVTSCILAIGLYGIDRLFKRATSE